MITKSFEINIDIQNTSIVKYNNISLVQGDTEVYIFNILLKDNGIPIDLTGLTTTITFLKPDGNSVVGNCDIIDATNGQVQYQLGTNEIAKEGKVIATVEIYENTKRLTSNQFQFTVRQQLNDGTGVTSTTEYPILTDLISQTQDIINNTDGKIGTQTYTEQNYVTNGESLTESVDSLDIQVKNNTDNILNHENRITTIESQNLDGRVTTLENDIQNANYTDTLTQNASIFSVGTGYKDDGTYLDVSSSVVKGQVSVTLKGVTRTNLIPTFDSGEWNLHANVTVNNPTKITLNATSASEDSWVSIPVVEGKTYTILVNSNGGIARLYKTDSHIHDAGNYAVTDATVKTSFTVDATYNGYVSLRLTSPNAGTFTFENVILEEGAEVGNFITGTKSTFNVRLKSVGKNILDTTDINKWEVGALGGSGENLNSTTALRTKGFIPVNSLESIIYSSSGDYQFYQWRVYDENKNFVETPSTNPYTVPSNVRYIRVSIKRVDSANIQLSEVLNANVQLEYGTTVTEYEEYKESISYILATDENGNVIKLNSLINGTKDEVSDDGKLVKNTDKVEIATTGWALHHTGTNCISFKLDLGITDGKTYELNDTPSIITQLPFTPKSYYRYYNDDTEGITWNYSVAEGFLYVKILKSKLATEDVAGFESWLSSNYPNSSLIYQLAKEVTYDLDVTPLIAFENGTVIIEPFMNKKFTYSAGISWTIPVSNIEKIEKVATGEIITDYTLASDGLSVTITNAVDGEEYIVKAPIKSEYSTIPSFSAKYPLNKSAQIDGNTQSIVRLSEIVADILIRM